MSDPDTVEIRVGVWNASSFTLSDEDRRGILARVILSLSSRKPVEQIAAECNVDAADVLEVIEHLVRDGLLIRGRDDLTRPTYYSGTALGRAEGITQSPPRAELIGPDSMGEFVLSTVPASFRDRIGFATSEEISILSGRDLFLDASGLSAADATSSFNKWQDRLIVAVWPDLNPILFSNLNRLSHLVGFVLLVTALDGPFAVLGPTVVPGSTPCFACAEARVLEALRDHTLYMDYRRALAEGRVEPAGKGEVDPFQATLLSLAAWEAVNILSLGTGFTAGKILTVYAPTLEIAFHELLRFPGCPVCASSSALEAPLYADLRDFLSKQLGPPKGQ